jgi:hypothetical protein
VEWAVQDLFALLRQGLSDRTWILSYQIVNSSIYNILFNILFFIEIDLYYSICNGSTQRGFQRVVLIEKTKLEERK